MIFLGEMANHAFVVLEARTSARQAREIVASLEESITHLIVRGAEPQGGYYLLTQREALTLLASAGEQLPLADALHLTDREPTPVLDAYADAETAPDRTIVVEDRRLVGFVDYTEFIVGWLEGTSKGVDGEEPGPGGTVTRTMLTRFRERIPLGTVAVLQVALSAQADAGPLALVAALGSQITVVVEPVSGFELEGEGEGILIVTSEEETLPLRFKLKATALGPGRIWMYAYQGVQPLGRFPVAAAIVSADDSLEPEPAAQPWPLAPAAARQPDLTLEIHQLPPGFQKGYQMRLAAKDVSLGLHFQPFPPVPFFDDPETCFSEFFEDIEGLLLDTPYNCEAAKLKLENKGYHLFETFFSPELRTLLWSLRHRITTISIVSDEPWIPWELCKLEGGENEGGPFLCEAFAITRWMAGIDPKPDLTLNRMAVVRPEESGLPHAPAEQAYLLSLASGGRQVERVPARFVELITTLRMGKHDGWHYTGHGAFSKADPNRSSIDLDDYWQMTPEDLSGPARNLGNARPLVFLNACQAGRGAMSLTGMGGWARAFLSAGAGAFVGAHWSIDDEIALEFAKEFYRRLLNEGQTIGEAAMQSRLKARDARLGDPTWLAYVVYAHPMAAVQ